MPRRSTEAQAMSKEIFEAALGVGSPWFVADMDFDEDERKLTIQIDFERGSRFELPVVEGAHPVHDTVIKRCRVSRG